MSLDDHETSVERRGYLGDAPFVEEVLAHFFSEIEQKLLTWQKEGVAGDVARQSIADSVTGISNIFRGRDAAYLPMESWNEEKLGRFLLEKADLPFPEGTKPSGAIEAYFTILAATFMQGWQAYQAGRLDKAQWEDWTGAMRRKMGLQLIGAPG